MRPTINRLIQSILLSSILIAIAAAAGHSEVVVFDDVAAVQKPIRIRVLTKGKFFAQGGRLVDIYLDEVHLKKILTGGDGFGYLKYTPRKAGFKSIKARSDGDSASGLHLIINESDKTIIIDVEGAFKDALFSEEIRENSQEVVKALSDEYKIIYISRFVGKGVSRSWLMKEDFPESVILSWQGAATLKAIKKRGVRLEAVIGSAAVVAAAKKHINNRYTFEESKDGTVVKDWKEILQLLQPGTPGAEEPDRLPVKEEEITPP